MNQVALSPGAMIGTLIAGLLLQSAVAFVTSLIVGARFQQKVDGLESNLAEIKRKLGNGGEGVFLRTDLAKEIIAGLSAKDTNAAETIASLRARDQDQAALIQSLQYDVAALKARDHQ